MGMRMTTTQAPSANFASMITRKTTPVVIAPSPFTATERFQPASLLLNQWRTMPPWLRVKLRNTPRA